MYDLGLASDAFWRLTPRRFAALCRRRRDEVRRADQRAALVACLIANANRDRKRRPKAFTVEDFMPGEDRSAQSPEQQATILRFAARASRRGRR